MKIHVDKIVSAIICIFGLMSVAPSKADDFVRISDASSLKWFQVNAGGQIYLRNLSDFDSAFLGCCFNYYIDLNSVAGRALWATMLVKMSAKQPIYLAVGSASAGGVIIYAGDW